MPKHIHVILLITFAFFIKGGGISYAENASAAYTIRPPQIYVPSGNMGEIKRIASRFENWSLVCDEDSLEKTLICNVTQSIYDENEHFVFSWSLAASEDGKPFLILRTLVTANQKVPIQIMFSDLGKPIKINYVDCDKNVCLAQTLVGPILSNQIEKESIAKITYVTTDGKTISFDAPLLGLKNAVQSIQKVK